jgi:hypothetical protein
MKIEPMTYDLAELFIQSVDPLNALVEIVGDRFEQLVGGTLGGLVHLTFDVMPSTKLFFANLACNDRIGGADMIEGFEFPTARTTNTDCNFAISHGSRLQ